MFFNVKKRLGRFLFRSASSFPPLQIFMGFLRTGLAKANMSLKSVSFFSHLAPHLARPIQERQRKPPPLQEPNDAG
jgi:hypothetical protein